MNFVHDILSGPLAFHGPSLLPWLSRRESLAEKFASPSTGPNELQSMKDYIAQFANQRRDYAVADGIATIHVNDVLSRNTTPIDRMFGMTDYAHVTGDLQQAVADPSVAAILVDINSPGGSAVGAPEAAAALANAARQKPVVAFVETMGASAAYYLAAGASVIVAGQSAIVGSIGTICSFLDFAGLLERIGITPHVFTPAASDLKATGTPFRAPTLAEANFVQHRTETLNAAFTGWVTSHRQDVQPDAMRGQFFTGEQAVALGLADQVGTMADALDAARALIAYSGN